MKTLKTILTTTLTIAALSSVAFAQSPGKGDSRKALTSQADFEALKADDQLVLVCKTSDSIQIIDVKDEKHALQLCKDGEMAHCPECKTSYKVRRIGNPARKGAAGFKREVVIVNKNGEPCMFYAKLSK